MWPSRPLTLWSVERDSAPGRGRVAEQKRCPRRSIDLVLVVHFQNFDVETLIERAGASSTSAERRLTPRLILPDLMIVA